MKGSSVNDMDAFQGIQWRNIREFLRLVLQSTLTSGQHIGRRYREQATNYEKTVHFLRRVGVVKEVEGHISVSPEWEENAAQGNEKALQLRLLSHVLQSRTIFRREVCDYIRRFRVVEGELVYCRDYRTHASKSFVRNFLMECGIVEYCAESDRYRLCRDYLPFYIEVRDRCRQLSPSVLRGNIEDREAIGWAAEETVLSYERNRVGPDFAHLVDQVSRRNVAAGYDIRSLTLLDQGSTIPRYIEVKAVSGAALTFYWTPNEIKVASLLGQGYYLYLVPVTGHGQCCIDRLRIVQDAYKAVLGPEAEWQVREGVVCCSLKE